MSLLSGVLTSVEHQELACRFFSFPNLNMRLNVNQGDIALKEEFS